MMAKLMVIILLVIGLFAIPVQPVKTAIIVLLFVIFLTIPVHFVFRLQRYLFNRYKKSWHLIALSMTQFICSAVPAYWLFNEFDQGVENGTIDGPVGFIFAGQIGLLTSTLFIMWIANSITAGMLYFRARNRQEIRERETMPEGDARQQ